MGRDAGKRASRGKGESLSQRADGGRNLVFNGREHIPGSRVGDCPGVSTGQALLLLELMSRRQNGLTIDLTDLHGSAWVSCLLQGCPWYPNLNTIPAHGGNGRRSLITECNVWRLERWATGETEPTLGSFR